jgi:hypothetical protein
VSRFNVGEAAAPRRAPPTPVTPTPLAPIKVKPGTAALPPAVSTALPGAGRRAPAQAGQWEEF